jgi:hypothetical protein
MCSLAGRMVFDMAQGTHFHPVRHDQRPWDGGNIETNRRMHMNSPIRRVRPVLTR